MITKTVTAESKEDAEVKSRNLSYLYGIGYGYYPTAPIQKSDGTWEFTYSRGSSCD